jgi:hypothetical protein
VDLPQLRRVWSGGKGAEEDSGLINKFGEGISAILSAKDEVEGESVAKVAVTGYSVKGALDEDVVTREVPWG